MKTTLAFAAALVGVLCASSHAAVTLDAPVINVSGPVSLSDAISITPSPCCSTQFYVWTFTPIPASTVISVTRPGTQLSLSSVGLHLGSYTLAVHASSGADVSPDATVTLNVVSSSLSGLRVFPNPWRSDRDAGVGITFDQLTPSASIKIFDLAGQSVRTLVATTNSVSWDRRNENGDHVASGMYFYLVTDSRGGKARGKLTVIK